MNIGGQENLNWLIALSKDLGRPVKALQEMPQLQSHLTPFWEGFDLLSTSRQVTLGQVGNILFSEILSYLDFEGVLGHTEQRRWIRYIKAMDEAFLSIVTKDSK